jgi:hypothetical protein
MAEEKVPVVKNKLNGKGSWLRYLNPNIEERMRVYCQM